MLFRSNLAVSFELTSQRRASDEAAYLERQARSIVLADLRLRDERDVSFRSAARSLGDAAHRLGEADSPYCTDFDESSQTCRACTLAFSTVVSVSEQSTLLGLCRSMRAGEYEATFHLLLEDDTQRNVACSGCTVLTFESALEPLYSPAIAWSSGQEVNLATTSGARAATLKGASPRVNLIGNSIPWTFKLVSAALVTKAPCMACPDDAVAEGSVPLTSLRLSGVIDIKPVSKKDPTPQQQAPPGPAPKTCKTKACAPDPKGQCRDATGALCPG